MTPLHIHCGYADIGHGQMHYAQCGPGDAPPVLLLHQSPRSWTEYRGVLPLLGLRYRAIAMDTAGFGASSRLPGEASIEGWAAAAAALLDALGIASAHVVGHHTGGVIAVELAAAYPSRVNRLVLSSTAYTDAAFRAERAQRPPIDAVAIRADGSHLAELWQRRQAFYPPDQPELLQAFIGDALKVTDLEEGHRAVASYRMEERIGSIRQPTLVIRAGRDPFAAPHAQPLCARLAQARLVDIAEGMVPLPEQLPEAFATAVLEFLDGAG